MTDLFKLAGTRAHAVSSKSSSRLHCSNGQSPQASPILVEGKNGKKITLDAGEFGKFTADPDVVTLAFAGLSVRFRHSFEAIDAAGRIHEALMPRRGPAISTRFGNSFVPIWRGWRWTRVPSASNSKIDRSFRSVNQLDVRQPELQQVDFWLPADDSHNSPMPTDAQHYPANLVD